MKMISAAAATSLIDAAGVTLDDHGRVDVDEHVLSFKSVYAEFAPMPELTVRAGQVLWDRNGRSRRHWGELGDYRMAD